MERINRSELANLETIANKTVTNNSPRGLLKIFIDRNKLMQDGLSTRSMQARLVEGEGVPWLSALLNPGFLGVRIYGAFPLLDPFNAESLKTQLKISGVYRTPVPGRWLLGGFSLSNIPDGGVQFIGTTDMENEPLLAQGDAVCIPEVAYCAEDISVALSDLNLSESDDASTNIPENTAYICVISHSIIAYNILD